MKYLIIFFIFILVSCSEDRGDEYTITVSNEMVCFQDTIDVGEDEFYNLYFGQGSKMFELSKAQKGYAVNVNRYGSVIHTYFCTDIDLQKYIEYAKYEIKTKDSLIEINP